MGKEAGKEGGGKMGKRKRMRRKVEGKEVGGEEEEQMEVSIYTYPGQDERRDQPLRLLCCHERRWPWFR